MAEVKGRNGLGENFISGKRNHTFTDSDLKREIKYMDLRKYCLQKMKNTQEHRDEHWQVTEEYYPIYMQGIYDACSDFLGWMEGRIDQDG